MVGSKTIYKTIYQYNLHVGLTLREAKVLELHAERIEKGKSDLVRDWIRSLPEYNEVFSEEVSQL